MSRFVSGSIARSSRSLCTLTAITLLTGCGLLTTRSDPQEHQNHLATAECPDLTELIDDSFGATSQKLTDVAKQYYKCREALLKKQPKE